MSIQSMSTEQQGSLNKSKKNKGFGKILRIFTGGKRSDKSSQKGREEGSLPRRSEDDAPLAPPPPLSYLVDRNSGDRTSRHVSNAVPNSGSVNRSSYPASSILQTPVSSRQSWLDRDPMLDARVSVVMENEPLRNIHPVLSEPDLRRKWPNTDASSVPSQRSSAQSIATIRPISTMSIHKSLPPLPAEALDAEITVIGGVLPTSDHQRRLSSIIAAIDPEGLPTPQPSFRNAEVRRQSFSGITSKPDFSFRRTAPLPSQSLTTKYDEFGASRRSLGPLEDLRGHSRGASSPTSTKRRKSKFGLSSLFGRFSLAAQESKTAPSVAYIFPSDSVDDRQEMWPNDNLQPDSRRSFAPRLSVASRKAIEELVDQDPEFVAYRYPSVGQSLEFLRP